MGNGQFQKQTPSVPTADPRAGEKAREVVKPVELIANAYALIPVKGKIDCFRTVRLVGVTAQQVIDLEPNGRTERGVYGLGRIVAEATRRWRRQLWGSKEE